MTTIGYEREHGMTDAMYDRAGDARAEHQAEETARHKAEVEDAITEAALELLFTSLGPVFHLCPGCDLMVHREDTGDHALTCLSLRAEVEAESDA